MFHIGLDYGISESAVCKIIMDTERKLIHDPRFHLPSKKVLTKQENTFEVVWIDVSETPVERPKKNKGTITAAKRKGALSSRK